MRKIKFTKETFGLVIILIISSVLNLVNLNIEGYGNEYYAAGIYDSTSFIYNLSSF
ncbi:hypothetical protein [Clostridium thailandense]|uniref:hypothetical protein n=1 Tax=Clostridium thailandense TaxID=2794346 RepID=UPI003988C348